MTDDEEKQEMIEQGRSWRRHKRRLGDFVEDALKPIVEVVDEKFGTNLKGCEACRRRKQWLNSLTEEKSDTE